MPILDLSIPLPHINFTVDMVDGVGGQELTFFLSHLMVLVNKQSPYLWHRCSLSQ